MRLGWDTATLEMVMEATGLQMWAQLEGLGGPSQVAGPSQPPAAVAVQPPVVVDT